jgi:transaldolase/glucose-6-phosphate isomerase
LNKIDGFRRDGKLADSEPILTVNQAKVFGTKTVKLQNVGTVKELIFDYLQTTVKPADYVAINAYLPRNKATIASLTELRKQILTKFGVATTLGFGPRFLHSTGQLHKGGPDNGVFVQITADSDVNLDIPGEGMTFNVLERAQAIGDFEALEARGRRVIRIQLSKPEPALLLK